MMKRIFLPLSLTLFASSALANVDPVVSEYQKIAALQMTEPSLADTLILVNGKTALECNQVATFDSLFNFDEVRNLNSYIKQAGGMDGSPKLVGLIDDASIAVCKSLKKPNDKNAQSMIEFESQLKTIQLKYANAIADGVEPDVAYKQLSSDSIEIRNELLDKTKAQ